MLYVPPAWLDVKFDDRAETVREVALGGWSAEKDELFDNIVKSTGVQVDSVTEVKPPSGMLDLLKTDGYVLAGPTAKANKVRQLRARLRDAVADTASVTPLPDAADVEHKGDQVFYPDQLRSRPTLLPNHLVKAPDDLAGGYDIAKVCALIALVKAEPRAALNAKLELGGNLGSDAAYYRALHDLYYGEQGIQYDEPSTHGPLYAEWGYQMVFSGSTFFRDLPTLLRGPLSPDRKYIASIKGHVVYIRMKKAMNPGPSLGVRELISDYFDFQSDPANYNVTHDKDVEYLFEK
ncbi:MAG: hypothetical protein JWM27_3031 [Gemmatimonadetes bacterium]|nr:hypothetical protein [Gemmatimonadota bacterium]